MKKQLPLLAVSAMALSISACTPEQKVLANPPGTYESKTVSTDANGTTIQKDNITDVSVDANGKKKAVVTSKTTKDPRGLFNKTTSESDQVIEEK